MTGQMKLESYAWPTATPKALTTWHSHDTDEANVPIRPKLAQAEHLEAY